MTPFEVYLEYTALKLHFTKEAYDYHRYYGKTKTSLQSFYRRKDRHFFEKMSRQKTDQEIIDFFVSNFVSCNDPQSLWVGEIIKNGENFYKQWIKKVESLSYIFKEEMNQLLENYGIKEIFEISGSKHPIIVKEYLKNSLSLESMLILNKVISYQKKFDKKLNDPIWSLISMKIEKYNNFLNIDKNKFKEILLECVK